MKPIKKTISFLKQKMLRKSIKNKYMRVSFSQMGEDLIVANIFNSIGILQPTYLDIGAYDPYKFSNTALFYLNGCRGVNIEPNEEHFERFLRERKEDINLNIGVAAQVGQLKYFKMSNPTLNTFSEEEAKELVDKYDFKIISIDLIEVDTISNIIQKNCSGIFPQFLSLDTEGLDLQILKAINFDVSFPLVICVETLSYSEEGLGIKDIEIQKYLESQGYMIFADTQINTIFVRRDSWIREQKKNL